MNVQKDTMRRKSIWGIGITVGLLGLMYLLYSAITIIPPDISTINTILFTKRRILQYAHMHNTLPAHLNMLAEIPGYNNALTDGWGNVLMYQQGSHDTIILTSRGKDRSLDTTDDIIRIFHTKTQHGEWLDELETKIEFSQN